VADYGVMMSFDDAVIWIEECAPPGDRKDRAIARLKYERDKSVPVKPRFHKGQYGKKYDYHTCGKCGTIVYVVNDYCPQCGRMIGWDRIRTMTGEKEDG